MQETLTKPVGVLLKAAQLRLQKAGSEDPQANAAFLLAYVLGVKRTWVEAFTQEGVSAERQARFEELLARHIQGEPLAYILGFQPFCGLDIEVSPAVLIPRPETEGLVEWAGRTWPESSALKILDLCTGSGCIGIALACAFKKAQVTAADLSAEALAVARANARRYGLADRITFIQSDLFEKIEGPFDLIVSNPPYIASKEIPCLAREVRQEPVLALDGGLDGLDIVRRLTEQAGRFVVPGGRLALEVGFGQPGPVAQRLAALGWNTEIKKDIFGIERFVMACKNTR